MGTIRRVHFVEFNARINVLGSGSLLPKYGTALLGAILRERGYEVRIFLEGISDLRLERMLDCDALCLPVYFPIVNKVRAFVREVRARRPGLPIIVGGPQAALFTDTVLELCDYAVTCEGDEVLPRLIETLGRGGDPEDVPGLAFRREGVVFRTPTPPPPAIPPTIPDLTLIEGFDHATRGLGALYVTNTLQTSRGCKFKCRFCPTERLFGGVYRNRDLDSIVRDIRAKLPYNRFFLVVDNSFLSNRRRTKELLRRLIQEDLGAHLMIFERHDIGREAETLKLMWQAGVRCIIVGIESLSDANLRQYDKRQVSEEVRDSVRRIMDQGIHVLGTFVIGGDGDTRRTAPEIVAFLRATGMSLNLFIMHDLEDDPTHDLLIPLERRFATYYAGTDATSTEYYDYFTGNFVTYFPRRMRPSTLQESLMAIYREAYSHHALLPRVLSPSIFDATFGVGYGYSMMRLTEALEAPVATYLGHLREIEQGLYDRDEVLIEDRLRGLDRLPLPPPLRDQVDRSSYRGLTLAATLPGAVRYGLVRLRQGLARVTARA